MLLSSPHLPGRTGRVLWGWLVTIHTVKHISRSSVSTPCMLGHRGDVTGRGTSVSCSHAVEVTVTLITVLMIQERLNHSEALLQSHSGPLSESLTFHGGFDSRWPDLGSTRQGTRGMTMKSQPDLGAPTSFKAQFRGMCCSQGPGLVKGKNSR